jgi:hypothetical protein
MKNSILIILSIFLLSSCANWQYKDVEYERCQYLESIHAHFYRHETCEWSCLNMEEGLYTYSDTFRLKYKTDKKGKIKKVKIVK